MAKAVGFRILVEIDDVKTTSEGGIVIVTDERLERNASVKGTVLDVGPEAFRAFNKAAGIEYSPWVKPGDRIYFAKYAGKHVDDEKTGKPLLFINDEDVVGLV